MTILRQEPLPLTSFDDLRIAELSPILQISFANTVTNTEIGVIEVSNGATVTHADGMCVVTSGTTAGADGEWETSRHAKHHAGFGGLMRFDALFTTGVANSEQMVGMADTEGTGLPSASHENGLGVGYVGTVFSFMRWNNDVLYDVAQTGWDDPMDGTGASGMTLDPTKLNAYFIDYQHGAGDVVLWIESQATGKPVKAHTVHYGNQNIVPNLYNANFHMMVHVISDTSTTNLIVKSSTLSYFIEGKAQHTELQQPQFSSGKQEKTTVTTEVAILTIRNKSTYNSLPNYLDVVLENLGVSIEASGANNLADIRLVKNATLGGTPSYTDINTANSIVDCDTAGTTVTGGTEILNTPMAGKNDRESIDIGKYDFVLGPNETVTIAGSSVNSATIDGAILWKELF